MKNEYTYINPDDIKVGDIVGIVQYGYDYISQYCRHDYVEQDVITRITQKRTKIFGSNGKEYNPSKTSFVKFDEYAKSENEKVKFFASVFNKFSNLRKIGINVLGDISDEDMLLLNQSLDTIQSIIEKTKG